MVFGMEYLEYFRNLNNFSEVSNYDFWNNFFNIPLDAKYLQSLFWNVCQERLRTVIENFWSNFKTLELIVEAEKKITKFWEIIFLLYEEVIKYSIPLNILIKKVDSLSNFDESNDFLKLILRAELLAQLPDNYNNIIQSLFSQVFSCHAKKKKIDEFGSDVSDGICCAGCNKEHNVCCCNFILNKFDDACQMLIELGVIKLLCEDVLMIIIYQQIEYQVQQTCKGIFEVHYLPVLLKWLSIVIYSWLNSLLTHPDAESIKEKLCQYVYKIYTLIRTEQLFNIIIEFPESLPALEDLKISLAETQLKPHLISSLKISFETRLLHPGVNTIDILTAYISAIKALRVLDPDGIILDLVCEPIRKYLRNRSDTVRCIVSSLTDENSGELTEELVHNGPLCLDDSNQTDDDENSWEQWLPDPIDVPLGKQLGRFGDIISILVNIYGSKELFIEEYRNLLAERILNKMNCDIAKEYRNLELLKRCFGENLLHNCEVMLKDISDSQRINTHVSSDGKDFLFPVSAVIISMQFWPQLRNENLKLPCILETHLELYTKTFETMKGNRTLMWKPHLGTVEIEIQFEQEVISLTVSTIHAAIIMQFESQVEWTLKELSQCLRIPVIQLRKKIAYWQIIGLLQETSIDLFQLQEKPPPGRKTWQSVIAETCNAIDVVDEDQTNIPTPGVQEENELQIYWPYIVGMLTNLDNMSLERIHSMLKMFAISSDCDIHKLKNFLDQKIKNQDLACSAGNYYLSKS